MVAEILSMLCVLTDFNDSHYFILKIAKYGFDE